MYRLKFRKTAAGIGALIVGAVLVLGVPYNATTAGLIYDLPLAPFLAAQVIVPFIFALSTYRACPFIQQMRAFLVTCSFIGFFGLLANINALTGFQIIQQDVLLHFNAVAFGAMNLAAFIAATNLMVSEQMSSFADTQVAEAQLERLKAVKVDPETQAKWEKAAAYADRSADGRSLRSTMTNLKAISLTEPGQELKPTMRETPKEDKAKDKGGARGGEDGSLANLLDRMEDEPLPGQELSDAPLDPALEGNSFINASDSETISTIDYSAPEPAEGGFLDNILDSKISAEAEEEKSLGDVGYDFGAPTFDLPEPETTDVAALLNNFDDESEAESPELASNQAPYAAPTSDFGATSQSEASSTAPETTRSTSFASASSSRSSMPAMPAADAATASPIVASTGASSAPAAPTAGAGAPTRPGGYTTNSPTNTNNQLAAIKRRNTSTFTKLNALSASGSGPLMPSPSQSQSLTDNEPDGLGSLLDRLDDDGASAEPAAKVVEAAKPIEPPIELTLDTVFKGDGVPEVAATPTTTAQPKAAVKEKEVEAVAAPVIEPVIEPVQEAEPEIEMVQAAAVEETPLSSLLDRSLTDDDDAGDSDEPRENVFGGGVDSDIDNIFSELAPPEAQLEVGQKALSSEESAFDAAPGGIAEGLSNSPEALAEDGEEEQANLFGSGVDSEIDDIFSELAPPEAQKEVKDVLGSVSVKEAETATAVEPTDNDVAAAIDDEEAAVGEGNLFGEDLGQELDSVFAGLTEGEQLEVTPSTLAKVKGDESDFAVPVKAAESVVAAPVAKVAPAVVPAEKATEAPAVDSAAAAAAKAEPAKYKEVKEFGRLSSKSPAIKVGSETGGTMKTIGKLLLDVAAVENIIKSGENRKIGSGLSTAKIISAARGEGIRNILTTIDTYEGVAGSLIVGHDGLVIASTVGTGWDKDMLGALSTALLSTSNLATKKLEIGKLRQMVMLTELTNGDGQKFKTTVLTDVDVGILAVFLEKTDLEKIDGLLETIQSTIHGG